MVTARSDTAAEALRVFVVDDDRRVRASLACLIGLREGLTVVGATAADGAVPALVATTHPDVVIVGLAPCEHEAGLALLRGLHRRWPALVLVATCVHDGLATASRAAGAEAVITTDSSPEAIGQTLVDLLAVG